MSERAGSPIDPDASTAPGQRLKAERERRGLSVQHVAAELHVGVSTIEALEAGRLASLGAPVHGKGHLRRYALLLGLDAEPLLAASSGPNDRGLARAAARLPQNSPGT